MNPVAAASAGASYPGWPLRLAQRAFVAVLEDALAPASAGAFRAAQLRVAARRTLSALSADEPQRLARWLALQLAARDPRDAERVGPRLVRIDAALAAHAVAMLPRTRSELVARPARNGAVAA